MANVLKKGPSMEEALRTYFSQAGYFVVRGVPFKYMGQDVTDIDAWIYSRSSPVSREIAIVDIKNKKTPQAIERIFWTLGLQKTIGADRAIVATSDKRPEVKEFGKRLNILVLDGNFLSKLEQKKRWDERISDEEFFSLLSVNTFGKLDGDWRGRISYCKSLLSRGLSFDICNDLLSQGRYFAEIAITRREHSSTALRCLYFICALVCICIDYLMRGIAFEESNERAALLDEGFRYGSRGKEGFDSTVNLSMGLITEYAAGGKALAGQIKFKIQGSLNQIPASALGEFFARRDVFGGLFGVAKELEELAMYRLFRDHAVASSLSKSVIGCLLDYWSIDRTHLSIIDPEAGVQPSLLSVPPPVQGEEQS
ncbi:hypothetical protein QRO11_07360 [Paracidovorax citrulli]|uniref:Uncharacterized protein n=3 Tax=Paracidovorax citrulli TaxID=80869 RepID=A1TNF5_PARC0|nr:hypothetical protein [Paracidovorax citrulli]ABM32493.1 conserved hypothetical protein [Paracidovorax citrulli AAC00-1]ATG93472.1 hypothetical protein CQB05_05010 [Paracidovorax citrulli]PVY66709.1 hypothetical protein C8E08_4130 [Paracidovorax citrulli]REG69126.1 hypothetical protein C8E07_2260 [Paracidovorax citrulli]RLJ93681.1 hypothetical protein C8E06_2260 [Paracidovorax citrulli]